MRSKTGWLALLLAGVALAPGGVRAQSLPGGENLDLAPPDPVFPLPLGHARMDSVGGLYTAAEFVMFRQTNPIHHQELAYRGLTDVDGAITGDLNGTVVNTDAGQPFIIRGPLVPGNFLGTHTLALSTDDLRGQESYQPGYRLTIGYKFDSGSALEFNWMHLISAKYAVSASLIPPNYANLGAGGGILADTFLFSPVFNFPAEYSGPIGQSVTNGAGINNPFGQPNQGVTNNGNGTYSHQKLAIGNPGSAFGIWNGANNESILFTQRFDQADIAGKVPWYQSDCTRVYGVSGARFAWFWERFKWRTVAADFVGQSFPEDVAVYNNIVSNRMYGAFAGIGLERYLGYGFAVQTDLQAAVLLDVVKESAYYQLGDRAITKAKKAATNFAVVPETNASVNLCWYPIEGIQMKVGYNFMAFFDTVQADQQVDFDFRSLDPNWKNRLVRYLDGLNAGIGFIF